MAEYLIQDTTLTEIADAIREKTGKTEQIKVQDISEEISNISSVVDYVNSRATTISPYAYAGNTRLRSVSFPNVTEVGNYAFDAYDDETMCSLLESVDLPSVTTIDYGAFFSCVNLTTVNLPLATEIEGLSFTNCEKLSSINAPNIEVIGLKAFCNSGLTSVSFEKCRHLYQSCFADCKNLTDVDLPLVSELQNSTFSNCTALKNVDVSRVDAVYYGAFRNCTSLEHIELPSISYVFASCSFKNCSKLVSVVLPNVTTVVLLEDVDAFIGTPIEDGTGYIYVPDTLVDSYKSATNWSTYASQIKPLSEYTGEI